MKGVFLALLVVCALSAKITIDDQQDYVFQRHLQGKDLPPVPSYTTQYFENYIDHFNYATQPGTYAQRYLINSQYWNGTYPGNCSGPIFFYTGNESPVTDYWANSGYITQVLAPKYSALILMAEHRYFGESMPFGNQSFTGTNTAYLSPEQALADYALLLTSLKQNMSAVDCPVFAFGGSYGGMLTTWMRIKYPNIIMGGLAASAPFAFPGTGISPYAFMDTCQATYEDAATGCSAAIGSGLVEMSVLANTQAGLNTLSQTFQLCKPLQGYSDALELIGWIEDGLVDMAMLDYPYPTDYGVIFPGWPVNNTCWALLNQTNNVTGLAAGMQNFFNSSGNIDCLDIVEDVPDWGQCCGWDYLACTEVYFPSAQRGMWWPSSVWNETVDSEACQQQFGVSLRPNWPIVHWGGFNLGSASNIIFSNGLLDPWHTSGVLTNMSDSLIAVVIPASAHHLDLRAPNPADPVYLSGARATEDYYIGTWLVDYWNTLKTKKQ